MTSSRHETKTKCWKKRAVLAALMGMLSSCGATPLSLEHVCKDYCEQVERASCPNSTATHDCTLGCVNNGALLDHCRSAWRAYVACASEQEMTCDADGIDVPPEAACEDAQSALDACVAGT